ncbi:MAG: hypothetical protein ACI4RV_02695 [Eubacteriales bacterium]
MKKRNAKATDVKKLVRSTLERYSVSEISPQSIKNILGAQGFTVIRYSALTPSEETTRLLTVLGVDSLAKSCNAFSYADRERRIVFVRKDVSDEETLYLLALELGRILTVHSHGGVIVQGTPAEEADAAEFAYHLTDMTRHGVLYNFFKFYPIRGMAAFAVCTVVAVVFGFTFAVLPHFSGETPLFADAPAESAAALTAPAASSDTRSALVSESTPAAEPVADLSADAESDALTAQESTETVRSDSPPNTPDIAGTTAEAGSSTAVIAGTDAEADSQGFVIPENQRIYYATKSGTKYHIAGCSYLNGKDTVTVSAEDIASGKYTPCSRCIGK